MAKAKIVECLQSLNCSFQAVSKSKPTNYHIFTKKEILYYSSSKNSQYCGCCNIIIPVFTAGNGLIAEARMECRRRDLGEPKDD